MFALADDRHPVRARAPSPLEAELQLICEMRRRVVESPELNFTSVVVRALVEEEIPRLVQLVQRSVAAEP